MKTSMAAVLGAMVLWASGTALAHHSPAVFDRSQQIDLEGVVAEFRWRNPHSSVRLEVTNEQGEVESWGIELGSPNHLVRAGWKSTTLKAGQKVTIKVYPLRNNEKGGQFVSVTFEDGSTMTENDPLSGAGGPGVSRP